MPQFDLIAIEGDAPLHLDTFEAGDVGEAAGLAALRLERQALELRCNNETVARISRDGRVYRTDSPPA